jgi:hypothetical protein
MAIVAVRPVAQMMAEADQKWSLYIKFSAVMDLRRSDPLSIADLNVIQCEPPAKPIH